MTKSIDIREAENGFTITTRKPKPSKDKSEGDLMYDSCDHKELIAKTSDEVLTIVKDFLGE